MGEFCCILEEEGTIVRGGGAASSAAIHQHDEGQQLLKAFACSDGLAQCEKDHSNVVHRSHEEQRASRCRRFSSSLETEGILIEFQCVVQDSISIR